MWNHQFLHKGAIRSPIVCFASFLSIHLIFDWTTKLDPDWCFLTCCMMRLRRHSLMSQSLSGLLVSCESHSNDSSVPPSPSGPQNLLQKHKLDRRMSFQHAHCCTELRRKTTNRIKPHCEEDHVLNFRSMNVTSLISSCWLTWLSASLWLASCTIWFPVQHNFKPFALQWPYSFKNKKNVLRLQRIKSGFNAATTT